MRTYIINLAAATERKEYMRNVLKGSAGLDIRWIDAVDGKCLTDEEKDELFDENGFIRDFQRTVKRGELGCVLSHQKCYKDLIDSEEDVAIVFEDDIVLKDSVEKIIEIITKVMPSDKPSVLLLSGWYWYSRRRKLSTDRFICDVIDARLAHAYVINKQAARIMYYSRPWFVADDWGFFRRKGVKIYSLLPHCVDQNWIAGFYSQTNTGESTVVYSSFCSKIRDIIHSIPRKIAKMIGHYIPPC